MAGQVQRLMATPLEGPQPHAPTLHSSGKSLAEPQHMPAATVPPVDVHSTSSADGQVTSVVPAQASTQVLQ